MKHRINPRGYVYYSSPPQREVDWELARQALKGDEDAWDELWEGAYEKAVQCALTAGKADGLLSREDCLDIVDEAFFRCYRDLCIYRGESRFSTWVCAYVKNVMMNWKKKRMTRLRSRRLLSDIALSRQWETDPLNILIEHEIRDCLWDAFDSLPDRYQDILSSRVLHHMTYRDIGKTLNIPRKQVIQEYPIALLILRRQYIKRYHCHSQRADQCGGVA